ncbi:hypothetical protein BDF14DRAFT_1758259 [Spinellus fusiger]|nr:hypothetical protein BDF14DRAFT_1758259 [Spinellus fusiger]
MRSTPLQLALLMTLVACACTAEKEVQGQDIASVWQSSTRSVDEYNASSHHYKDNDSVQDIKRKHRDEDDDDEDDEDKDDHNEKDEDDEGDEGDEDDEDEEKEEDEENDKDKKDGKGGIRKLTAKTKKIIRMAGEESVISSVTKALETVSKALSSFPEATSVSTSGSAYSVSSAPSNSPFSESALTDVVASTSVNNKIVSTYLPTAAAAAARASVSHTHNSTSKSNTQSSTGAVTFHASLAITVLAAVTVFFF